MPGLTLSSRFWACNVRPMSDWLDRLKWLVPAAFAVGGLLFAGNWYLSDRAEAKLTESAAREATERLSDAVGYLAGGKGIKPGDLIAKVGVHVAEIEKLKLRIRISGAPHTQTRIMALIGYVEAVEIRPDSPAVHHAVLAVDPSSSRTGGSIRSSSGCGARRRSA